MTVVSSGARDVDVPQSGETSQMLVSMEFQDANLKDVLKTFSQQSGINVIASQEIGDRTITLYLEDVTVMDALDQILAASGLTYERPADSQIYIVKEQPPAEEPKIVTESRVYRLRFARVSSSRLARAVEALGSQTPFEAKQLATTLGTIGTGGGGGGGVGGGGVGGGGAGAGTTKEIGIDKVIEALLSEQGDVVVDERTNSLVVTDVPDSFPRIEAVLNALDIRTAQILIESEILETTLAKAKELGIQWGTGGTAAGDIATLALGKRSTRFPFGLFDDRAPTAATGATGFSTSTLDFASAKALLEAIEKDTDTKILARPKILTLDNESAVIRLTSQQAVGFQTTTGEQTATTTVTPERSTTGVILVVTPQVNEDGFVTMLVEPSVTKVVAAQVTPPSNAGTVVDPKSRSARALVRIRNGETLVLGGLIDRSESETLRRVPILSGIPVLGEAFKDTTIDDSTSELIVFVTPRILTEPAGPQMASAGQAPFTIREQEPTPSRQELIDEALKRLEPPL